MKRHRAPHSQGSVVDRMRVQMAMKRLREDARRLGVNQEDYLANAQTAAQRRTLDETSETLAKRIVDKALQSTDQAPALPGLSGTSGEGSPDLKGLVEQILRKGGS